MCVAPVLIDACSRNLRMHSSPVHDEVTVMPLKKVSRSTVFGALRSTLMLSSSSRSPDGATAGGTVPAGTTCVDALAELLPGSGSVIPSAPIVALLDAV